MQDYSSSLKHPLWRNQWLLKHEMGLLHVIDYLGWCTHQKSYLKTFIMNRRLKNDMYERRSVCVLRM